jgi:uncharacterized protein (DUF1800 family)
LNICLPRIRRHRSCVITGAGDAWEPIVSAAAFLGRHLCGNVGRSLRIGLSAASLAVLAACGGFWQAAVTGEDQLRQRVAFALSQIFVDLAWSAAAWATARARGAWLDMLADKGLGNYRDLLEAVSLHPMMGTYLSHLRNQKADPRTGRVPDENYRARGDAALLHRPGRAQRRRHAAHRRHRQGAGDLHAGRHQPAWRASSPAGAGTAPTGPDNSCFFGGSVGGNADADRTSSRCWATRSSTAPRRRSFLGVTLAAQTRADPYASLKTGLDTLFNHPNVGPFIGRQLIQRLVTSNPSPAYVRAVAAAFATTTGPACVATCGRWSRRCCCTPRHAHPPTPPASCASRCCA